MTWRFGLSAVGYQLSPIRRAMPRRQVWPIALR